MNIIDSLPGNSRYAEAVADDDEAAEYFLTVADQQPTKPRMRLADWSPEVAELRVIAERLATVSSVIAGNRVKFPPLPRPEVAVDRAKFRKAVEKHDYLVALLIPDSAPEV